MPQSLLDHLVVTAPSLEAGAAFVSETLGASLQPGGEHPSMGTHNILLRLGQTVYMEVISPNPAAPTPDRPRLFGLDDLGPHSPPRLATWVVRTSDIHGAVAAASEPLGPVEPMSRGALNWLLTVPADGSIPLNGAGPALIEWPTDVHPAARLEDHGLALVRLEILDSNPDRVSRLLASLALEAPVVVLAAPSGAPARLIAHIDTPQGLRTLSCPQSVASRGALR